MANPRAKELEAIALFAGLSRQDRELLAKNLDEVTFAPEATLIQQGATNHAFFVLVEGEADTFVSGARRRTLRSGDFFGEISMEQRVAATATIIATTPLRALVMGHDQFRALEGSPTVLSRLKAAINNRLANDRMSSG